MDVSVQLQALAALPLGKTPPPPTEYEAERVPEPGGFGKDTISCPCPDSNP